MSHPTVNDAKGSGLTKFCSKCGQTKPIAEFDQLEETEKGDGDG